MENNINNLPENYTGLHSKTKEYINDTDVESRNNTGQYFTPRELQIELIKKLPNELLNKDNLDILDPASGTGEFLYTLNKISNGYNLHGWELDENLVDISKEIVPEAKITQTNTLKKNDDKKYDLIIGNPPYFQFKPDDELKSEYDEILYGRVNIYSLFIYKSIEMLKDGGYLAFINPPSMNNGAYFYKLRDYIIDNCNIENISILKDADMFEDAQQSIMLFVVKKGDNNGDYVFKQNSKTIFSEGADYLEDQFKDKSTLKELNYEVKTGKIVWNNNKDKLTNNSEKGVPLIWSKNITNNGLELGNYKREQYIESDNPNVGPAIVVNRIVGQPGKGSVRASKIPKDMKFLAENHVNVIKPKEESKIDIDSVLEQLNDPENVHILQKITGNSQLSKTELEELFPIKNN